MASRPKIDSSVHIRDAEFGEATMLTKIAISAKGAWDYSKSTLKRWEPELTISEDAIKEHLTFVAVTGGAAIGFCMLDCEDDRWELEHFWIAPKFMRRGVGRKLLAHAIDAVRERHGSELHIDADPNAAAFYQACGAVPCGVVAAPIDEDPKRVRPQLVLSLL